MKARIHTAVTSQLPLHFIPWSKGYNKPEGHCSSSSEQSYYLNITGKCTAVLWWKEPSSIITLANALKLLLFYLSSNIAFDSMVFYGLIFTVRFAVLRLHPGKAIHQNFNELLSPIAQKRTLNLQVKTDEKKGGDTHPHKVCSNFRQILYWVGTFWIN